MKENHQEIIEKCQAIASKLQGAFEYDADTWGFGGTLTGIAPYPILVSMAKTGETIGLANNRFIFHARLKMNFSYEGEEFQLFAGDCVKRSEYDQIKKEISVAASRPVEQIAHELLSRLMRPLVNIWPQMEKVRDARLASYRRMDTTVQETVEKFKAVGITVTLTNNDWRRDRDSRRLYCQGLHYDIQVMDGKVLFAIQNTCLTPAAAAAIAQIIQRDTANATTA